MNRLNWTLVLVPLALVGLLACQGAAFGDDMDLPLAPLPSGVTAAAYAPPVPAAPAVPTAPSVTVTTPCGWPAMRAAAAVAATVTGSWASRPSGWRRSATSGWPASKSTDHDAIVADTCIQEEMTFTPRITFGWQGECWGVAGAVFPVAPK